VCQFVCLFACLLVSLFPQSSILIISPYVPERQDKAVDEAMTNESIGDFVTPNESNSFKETKRGCPMEKFHPRRKEKDVYHVSSLAFTKQFCEMCVLIVSYLLLLTNSTFYSLCFSHYSLLSLFVLV
jgi:hypothetical protein